MVYRGKTYLLSLTMLVQNLKKYRCIISFITGSFYSFLLESEKTTICNQLNRIYLWKVTTNATISHSLIKIYCEEKDFTAAWIDYRKVFDSLLHFWIVERIMLSGVYPAANKFIRKSMKTWISWTRIINIETSQHNKQYLSREFLIVTALLFWPSPIQQSTEKAHPTDQKTLLYFDKNWYTEECRCHYHHDFNIETKLKLQI